MFNREKTDFAIESIDPHKRIRRSWMFTFFVIAVLLIVAYVITTVNTVLYEDYEDEFMGLKMRLIIQKTSSADRIAEEAFAEFRRVYEKYTDQYGIFPLDDYEDGKVFSFDEETTTLIKELNAIAESSKGLYDYTIGNIALLYENEKIPSEEAIDNQLEHVGFFNVQFTEEQTLRFYNNVKLYLRPIALPYAMDAIKSFILERDEKQTGYIQVGRNLCIFGRRNGSTDWMDQIPVNGEDEIVYLGGGSIWRGTTREINPINGEYTQSLYNWGMVITDSCVKSKTALMTLSLLKPDQVEDYIKQWSLICALDYDGKNQYYNKFDKIFYNDNGLLD
ncbi:MAG TPA: FAD:protein FMN transferase [Thermotogota bacterium]|nr:FAD:protein FMN transferase [Thermotogota bacterium]HPJ90016.1 FAD:protein FMN transferase [Thermotogota bacterium]HPR97586.1 FAD:protein FMN transferase [Thermotogota bacterium]